MFNLPSGCLLLTSLRYSLTHEAYPWYSSVSDFPLRISYLILFLVTHSPFWLQIPKHRLIMLAELLDGYNWEFYHLCGRLRWHSDWNFSPWKVGGELLLPIGGDIDSSFYRKCDLLEVIRYKSAEILHGESQDGSSQTSILWAGRHHGPLIYPECHRDSCLSLLNVLHFCLNSMIVE